MSVKAIAVGKLNIKIIQTRFSVIIHIYLRSAEYRLEINFYRLGLLLILYNKKRILAIEILKEMLYNQSII